MRVLLCILTALVVCAIPLSAGLITGVSIYQVSSEFTGFGWDLRAIHLVDGSGLSGIPPVHAQTNFPGGQSWQTSDTSHTAGVIFDLGQIYSIGGIHIWNLNFYSPYNGRGVSDLNVFYSFEPLSDYTLLLRDSNVPSATGLDGDPGYQLFSGQGPSARYIYFDILNNHRGDDNAGHVGLSEVQFFSYVPTGNGNGPPPSGEIPEPATVLLTGAALGLLAFFRRR